MAGTDLKLTHYYDQELKDFRAYIHRDRNGASLAAEAISPYSVIVSLLPLVFIIVSGSMLLMGSFNALFGALLAGSVAIIAVLLWARIVQKREEKQEDILWDRLEPARVATAKSIDNWLFNSYGVAIDDFWSSSDLATMIFQGKLDSSETWTLATKQSGKIEGRFVRPTADTLELRKAVIADTDESVYFKPVLAAV